MRFLTGPSSYTVDAALVVGSAVTRASEAVFAVKFVDTTFPVVAGIITSASAVAVAVVVGILGPSYRLFLIGMYVNSYVKSAPPRGILKILVAPVISTLYKLRENLRHGTGREYVVIESND